MTAPLPAREALFAEGELAPDIPVCDHYCSGERRMRKALALQAEMGPVFDITLDCADSAPIGEESAHAVLVAELALGSENRFGRVGARVHPVGHPAFEADVETLIGRAGDRLAHLLVPQVRGLADAQQALAEIFAAARRTGRGAALPVHVQIETHGALRDVFAIAALQRVQSLSFGLFEFVGAHAGAIPYSALGAEGQFRHPLVTRAKIEIAAACHAAGKAPSHSVVAEFRDETAVAAAATRAAREFGYTRMWSIHPAQIRPIIDAFAPTAAEVDEAIEIILAARAAYWAPLRRRDTLHDRTSYRYFWQVIARARRTDQPIPAEVEAALFGSA